MGSNEDDKKRNRRLFKAFTDSAVRSSDKKIRDMEKIVERFVKPANADYICDDKVEKLIRSSKGRVMEKIPFEDGSNQFRIEIQKAFLPVLEESKELLRVSAKPFKASSHIFNPRLK